MASPRGAGCAKPIRLSALITEAIGDGWVKDLAQLRALEAFADDAAFRQRWRQVKHACKVPLIAQVLREQDAASPRSPCSMCR